MYKNVLIPTLMDNEAGIKTAVEAARRLLSEGGTITLLNIVEEVPLYVEAHVPQEVLASSVQDANDALARIGDMIGKDLKTKAIRGHAGRTIVDEAKTMHVDLIIILSHQPGISDYFLGSTAGYTVRHSVCPVLVLR